MTCIRLDDSVVTCHSDKEGAEAARLGAFLEAAEQYGKDDEYHDQQHDPQQASGGPRSWPAPALSAAEQGPVHTRVYAQAQHNMPRPPNYLNPRG